MFYMALETTKKQPEKKSPLITRKSHKKTWMWTSPHKELPWNCHQARGDKCDELCWLTGQPGAILTGAADQTKYRKSRNFNGGMRQEWDRRPWEGVPGTQGAAGRQPGTPGKTPALTSRPKSSRSGTQQRRMFHQFHCNWSCEMLQLVFLFKISICNK